MFGTCLRNGFILNYLLRIKSFANLQGQFCVKRLKWSVRIQYITIKHAPISGGELWIIYFQHIKMKKVALHIFCCCLFQGGNPQSIWISHIITMYFVEELEYGTIPTNHQPLNCCSTFFLMEWQEHLIKIPRRAEW